MDLVISTEKILEDSCFSPNDLETTYGLKYAITEWLWGLDCYVVGEPFSLGNFYMGYYIFNAHKDGYYIISDSDLEKIKNGEEATLSFLQFENGEERQQILQGFLDD